MKHLLIGILAIFSSFNFIASAQDIKDESEEIEKERKRWNSVLVHDSAARFNRKPNSLLVETVKGIKKGTALDIGMGQGRNSLFLAKDGWDVTGIDVADEAVNYALDQAKVNRVKIDAQLIPIQKFDFGENKWDLIVHVYEGCLDGDNNKLEKIEKSLKPGGLIVYEFFHLEGGAKLGRPDFGCTTANTKDLLEKTKHLKIITYKEEEAVADYTLKKLKVIKMVAKKK